MKQINFLEGLRTLDSEDLLNGVGVTLLNTQDKFVESLAQAKEWAEENFASQEQLLGHLGTSSLVGADDEKTIEDWIIEEERKIMEKELEL